MHVATLLFYSSATAFCVFHGVKLLDFCMDYPNPLWRIRYRLAMYYTADRAALEANKAIADAATASEKPEIMRAVYDLIVAENPRFKRFTCIWCLATFTGIFISLIIAAVLLPLYGWWVILYWWSVFPFIAFFGRI